MPFPSTIYGLIDELPTEREGSPFNADMTRTYTRRFLVEMKGGLENGKGFGPIAVCSHPFLPQPWAPYYSYNGLEWDQLALLIKYEAVPRDKDDFSFWIVTAYYDTRMPEGGQFQIPTGSTGGGQAGLPTAGTSPTNNPELEYPDIRWDYEEKRRVPLVDLDGKPYLNSAGQPMTPPFTYPLGIRVLEISRNELNFDQTVADEYAYSLNDAVFLGHPPNMVQCMPPKAQQLFRGTFRFWRVTYRLRFYPRGEIITYQAADLPIDPNLPPILDQYEMTWQPVIQDQGYMIRDASGKLTNIQDSRSKNITQQQLLIRGKVQTAKDANGQLYPSLLFFRQFPSKNFNTLIDRGFTS